MRAYPSNALLLAAAASSYSISGAACDRNLISDGAFNCFVTSTRLPSFCDHGGHVQENEDNPLNALHINITNGTDKEIERGVREQTLRASASPP